MFEEFIKEIFKISAIKYVSTILVGSLAIYAVVDTKKPAKENIDEEENPIAEIAQKHESKAKRKPASILSDLFGKKEEHVQKSKPKITAYDKSDFVRPDDNAQDIEPVSTTSSGNNGGYYASSSSAGAQEEFGAGVDTTPTPSQRASQGSSSSGSTSGSSSPTTTSYGGSIVTKAATTSEKTFSKISDKKNSTSSNESSGTTSPNVVNNCSVNTSGGSFGNSIAVTISCTYPSDIKYCLSRNGSCCDPMTAGSNYGSQVTVGPTDGNYCLSYYGDSDAGGNSVVYENSYKIKTTLPNLTVGHEKIYYQTTELEGKTSLTSLDFGKPNYFVGQINLKTHDPAADTDLSNCSAIVKNYVDLPAPFAVEILAMFDVGLASPSSQVEIPLALPELDYGENFITSYIADTSLDTPLYSCSTSVVKLEDFEYFQFDSSQSVAGTNNVREFEGEFSQYGFFEDETLVIRAPAGVNSAHVNNQDLKSGLYGMFY